MMAFILSKMNLLILVSALFAIIVFFTFSLNDSFLIDKAKGIANDIEAESISIISSDSMCSKNKITIPKNLGYSGGKQLFYILEISKVVLNDELPNSDEKLYGLQFSIRKRDSKGLGGIIASSRVNVNAKDIYLMDVGYGTPDYGISVDSLGGSSTILDPQSVTPINAFVLAKERKLGETYLYIVPCNASINCAGFQDSAYQLVLNGVDGAQNDGLGSCLKDE